MQHGATQPRLCYAEKFAGARVIALVLRDAAVFSQGHAAGRGLIMLASGMCCRQPEELKRALRVLRAEESARAHVEALVPAVEQLVAKVTRLYEGTSMPVSDVWLLPSAPKT